MLLAQMIKDNNFVENKTHALGIFSLEGVSSLFWCGLCLINNKQSFVTIGHRLLANPLKVRFHYGHPDVFDMLFHFTRGSVSKPSKIINLSEDIFAGNVTRHE